MTDPRLVHRAEQALLGAMLVAPGAAAGLPGPVTAASFTDPRHQAIFASLTGTAGEERGMFGRLRGFFAQFSRTARDTAAYRDSLPGLCPDAAHIDSYYRMVADAAGQRQDAVRADQVARGVEILAGAVMRLAGQPAGKAADATSGLPADVARVARALSAIGAVSADGRRNQGRSGDQDLHGRSERQGRGRAPQPSAASPDRARAQAPEAVAARGGGAAVRAQRVPAGTGVVQEGKDARREQAAELARIVRREDVQDLVLAALLRDADEARQVTGWLPPEAFSDGQRRELFVMIGQAVRERRDIDEVILAWDVAHRSALTGDGDRADGEGWARPGFVLGLAGLATTAGTAAVLGRQLLAERLCDTRFGADWARPEHPAGVGARPALAADAGTAPQAGAAQRQEPVPQQKQPARQAKAAPAVGRQAVPLVQAPHAMTASQDGNGVTPGR